MGGRVRIARSTQGTPRAPSWGAVLPDQRCACYGYREDYRDNVQPWLPWAETVHDHQRAIVGEDHHESVGQCDPS